MIHFDTERPADAPAREALLDRVMGRARAFKPSERLRRGRKPADGLALVARDSAGDLVGTVRLWHVGPATPLPSCSGRSPSTMRRRAKASAPASCGLPSRAPA